MNKTILYLLLAVLGVVAGTVTGIATAPDDQGNVTATDDVPPPADESGADPPASSPAPPETVEPETVVPEPVTALEPSNRRLDAASIRGALTPALVAFEGASCGGAVWASGVQVGDVVITAAPMTRYARQLFGNLARADRWAPVGDGRVVAFLLDSARAGVPQAAAGDPLVGDEVLLVGMTGEYPGVVTAVTGSMATVTLETAPSAEDIGAPIGVGDADGPLLVATSAGSTQITAEILQQDAIDAAAPLRSGGTACGDAPHLIDPPQWRTLLVEDNQALMLAQQLEDGFAANDVAIVNQIQVTKTPFTYAVLTDPERYGNMVDPFVIPYGREAPGRGGWKFALVVHESGEFGLSTTRWCVIWDLDLDAGTITTRKALAGPMAIPGWNEPTESISQCHQ